MKRNLSGDWQDLEVFLGSYTISIDIMKDEKGKVSYKYTVVNKSHIESLTRFLRNTE